MRRRGVLPTRRTSVSPPSAVPTDHGKVTPCHSWLALYFDVPALNTLPPITDRAPRPTTPGTATVASSAEAFSSHFLGLRPSSRCRSAPPSPPLPDRRP